MKGNDRKISDSERDSALEALGVHFAQGRLQLDEYERRSDQAVYAETYDELDRVFVDLPLPRYDSVIEPYPQPQVPQTPPKVTRQTWKKTSTPPSGKTRVWKRPFGMSKAQAILIGWLLTFVLIALYGIGFVTVTAVTGSETAAVMGVFGVAGASVITLVLMTIITILISTSYDPDANRYEDDGGSYPY